MSKQHPPTLTALFVFVSFILLSVDKPILLTAQDAPDTSPITDQITPVVDELTFAPPTETATATETASATLTATASATETPSATASETPTLGPTEPATATSSATPLDTPTLGPTEPATFTPLWTETPFPTLTLPPMLTATATLPSPFGPEPPLQPLLTDTFDTGALYFWTLGAGWSLIASEGGQALANPAGDEPVTFVHHTLTDLAVQLRVHFEAGMFRLSLRQSEAGAYTALLSADGQVALYRGTSVLGAALVPPNQPGQWRTLRLSAIGDLLRVQVDGVEVMAVQDAAPLLQGTFAFAGVGASGGVVLDDVVVVAANIMPAATPTFIFTPTITPTPSMFSAELTGNGMVAAAIQTTNYAVVENTPELVAAVMAGTPKIYLTANTFALTSRLKVAFNRNITIYGLGSEVSIITTSGDGVLEVEPTGALTLQDLTLAGVPGTPIGFGGQISNRGALRLRNVVLRNSTVAQGGGVIHNLGGALNSELSIHNSIFRLNSSSGGGAAIQSELTSAVTITCTRFESNTANSFGGAIYIAGGATISNSVFNGNTAGNAGGAIAFNGASATPNANGNWWPTWSNGNGTLPGISNPASSPQSPNLDTIQGFTVSTARNSDPHAQGGPCPVAPYVLPPSPSQELALYGITVDPNITWTTTTNAAQLNVYLFGVRDTAISLGIQSISNINTPDDSPRETFKRVFTSPRVEETSNTTVSGIQFSVASQGYCITTQDTGATSPFEATITCSNTIPLTRYTVTHELGHVFIDRTGGQVGGITNFYGLMQSAAVSDANPLNAGIQAVFGTGFLDQNRRNDWGRGPRGWGTGPTQDGRCDGSIIIPTPILAPSDFQQNPCNVPDASSPSGSGLRIAEVEEAGADMFLNWVYRLQGNGGFVNTDWSGCGATGCYDGPLLPDGTGTDNNPGDVRQNWMNQQLTSLFANYLW